MVNEPRQDDALKIVGMNDCMEVHVTCCTERCGCSLAKWSIHALTLKSKPLVLLCLIRSWCDSLDLFSTFRLHFIVTTTTPKSFWLTIYHYQHGIPSRPSSPTTTTENVSFTPKKHTSFHGGVSKMWPAHGGGQIIRFPLGWTPFWKEVEDKVFVDLAGWVRARAWGCWCLWWWWCALGWKEWWENRWEREWTWEWKGKCKWEEKNTWETEIGPRWRRYQGVHEIIEIALGERLCTLVENWFQCVQPGERTVLERSFWIVEITLFLFSFVCGLDERQLKRPIRSDSSVHPFRRKQDSEYLKRLRSDHGRREYQWREIKKCEDVEGVEEEGQRRVGFAKSQVEFMAPDPKRQSALNQALLALLGSLGSWNPSWTKKETEIHKEFSSNSLVW